MDEDVETNMNEIPEPECDTVQAKAGGPPEEEPPAVTPKVPIGDPYKKPTKPR